ncbi:hypothetical protein F5B22DRAFT_629151 [Xylaria bambusicola]|uniref:uncharacterized protein n=1 Tax=Xylaria bambusicola TaxID=326684 RepID=UPI0020087E9C|nr:uncharacterized protein F5B22DRAFT_629151 [Xylaria bambusicola]KAI0503433.1 hypothetical protein F5B22DRAFT_629151 [Xylaria bambusicola]
MASASTTSAELAEAATDYTRLHITPFDLSLQSVVIPASVLPRARNISYHTIETFPEKRFGFVDLPTMDADKLKKKLNGAVLKGSKIRVETVRPESAPQPDDDTTDAKKEKKKKKKSKKRKHETDVTEGVQLDGRKVKRGWTTTEQEMIEEKRKKARKDRKEKQLSKDEKKEKKDKKKRATVKSKYTDEPECLFKTKLPSGTPSVETKETGDEESSSHKKIRGRRGNREVIVHEFEKTTKYPTFLKSSSTGAGAEATTFEDGVGWVDGNGNVVEPVKSKRRPEVISAPIPAKPEKTTPLSQEKAVEEEDDDDETSSSGSSSSGEDDDTSSSGSDSEASDQPSKTVNTPKKLEVKTPDSSSPLTATKPDSARPKSSGSITSLSIKIPPATPAAKKIHPLEALYKRPQGADGESNGGSEMVPFSFFGNEDDMEDENSTVPMSQAPMTPFTKQEFEFRNIRSAAPTPDTAHPSRSFNFWASQDSVDDNGLDAEDSPTKLDDVAEEEDEQQDEDVDMEGNMADEPTSQTPASDFQKQFWESRGDLNRAWRKRRKAAAKEKRYRENRARAERAI